MYEKLICAELNILLISEYEVISLDVLLFTFQHLEESKQAAERNCNVNLLLKYFFLMIIYFRLGLNLLFVVVFFGAQ